MSYDAPELVVSAPLVLPMTGELPMGGAVEFLVLVALVGLPLLS